MHTTALVLGAVLHIWADITLCLIGSIIWAGPRGYIYDEYYEYPSRLAAAFALLPIPVGLSLGSTIVVRWGLAE